MWCTRKKRKMGVSRQPFIENQNFFGCPILSCVCFSCKNIIKIGRTPCPNICKFLATFALNQRRVNTVYHTGWEYAIRFHFYNSISFIFSIYPNTFFEFLFQIAEPCQNIFASHLLYDDFCFPPTV